MADRPLIALTGATGFVGRALSRDLSQSGFRVRCLLRRPTPLGSGADEVVIGDITRPINLVEAMRGVDFVVHSAGVAHAMSGRPDDDYRAVNREATINLARAAAHAGVKRFLFLSSVRAQSGPFADAQLNEAMEPRPTDAYGRSKLEAEQALSDCGVDWVALRPVLVYGPGVKGNLATLFALARRRTPLPFGGFSALRSMLSVNNLTDAVAHLLRSSAAMNRAYLVADPDPVSLPEVIAAYRAGLGRRPGLLRVPPAIVAGALILAGRREMAERLSRPLVVDCGALRATGWRPRLTTREGLTALGEWDASAAIKGGKS